MERSSYRSELPTVHLVSALSRILLDISVAATTRGSDIPTSLSNVSWVNKPINAFYAVSTTISGAFAMLRTAMSHGQRTV